MGLRRRLGDGRDAVAAVPGDPHPTEPHRRRIAVRDVACIEPQGAYRPTTERGQADASLGAYPQTCRLLFLGPVGDVLEHDRADGRHRTGLGNRHRRGGVGPKTPYELVEDPGATSFLANGGNERAPYRTEEIRSIGRHPRRDASRP